MTILGVPGVIKGTKLFEEKENNLREAFRRIVLKNRELKMAR